MAQLPLVLVYHGPLSFRHVVASGDHHLLARAVCPIHTPEKN